MLNFLKQSLLFLTVKVASGLFRYIFIIVNVVPLLLYFIWGFSAGNLLSYFLLEALAYCFMNLIYIKLLDFPLSFVKLILVILCSSLILLATYFIPSWNEDHLSENRIAFWNYAAILFTSYTIGFFAAGEGFYNWNDSILKKNVIIKFCILIFVTISGSLLSKYIKSDMAFLAAMIGTKTIIDFVTLQSPRMELSHKNK